MQSSTASSFEVGTSGACGHHRSSLGAGSIGSKELTASGISPYVLCVDMSCSSSIYKCLTYETSVLARLILIINPFPIPYQQALPKNILPCATSYTYSSLRPLPFDTRPLKLAYIASISWLTSFSCSGVRSLVTLNKSALAPFFMSSTLMPRSPKVCWILANAIKTPMLPAGVNGSAATAT